MGREIRVYLDITPNGDGCYFVYSDVSKYLTFLEDYEIQKIPFNNYRLNGNLLIIPTNEADGGIYSATYVSEVHTYPDAPQAAPVARFWKVQRVLKQSGNAYLTLIPDEFANGINRARFDYLHALRANRYVSAPMFYDAPAQVGGTPTFKPLATLPVDIGDLYIVLQCSLETWKSSAAGQTNNTTAIHLFAFPVKSLTGGSDADGVDLANAIANAGTLFQWKTGTGVFEGHLDAKALRAWVVPKEWLQLFSFGPGDATFTFRNILASSDVSIRLAEAGGEVPPQQLELQYLTKLTPDELAGNRVFAGTYGHLVELPRAARRANAYFRVIVDTNGLRVYLRDNGADTDISDAFEAYLSSDENVETYSQQIANAVRFLGTAGLAAGKAYGKRGGAGALGSLAGTYLDALSATANTEAVDHRGQGDALTTYLYLYKKPRGPDEVLDVYELRPRFPFQIALFPVEDDFYVRADLRGASTDCYLNAGETSFEALKNLESRPYLTTKEPESTYLQADCAVLDLPESERLAIQAAFAKGVWFKCLS